MVYSHRRCEAQITWTRILSYLHVVHSLSVEFTDELFRRCARGDFGAIKCEKNSQWLSLGGTGGAAFRSVCTLKAKQAEMRKSQAAHLRSGSSNSCLLAYGRYEDQMRQVLFHFFRIYSGTLITE